MKVVLYSVSAYTETHLTDTLQVKFFRYIWYTGIFGISGFDGIKN